MAKQSIVMLLGLLLILSCSKDKRSAFNPLVGTWVFTSRTINSYAYPSVLTGNTFPVGNSSFSTSLDSIKITFQDNGTYTFWNFRLPVDNGKYTIARDSLLIIKPDTAGFVKFNYSSPSFTAGSTVPPPSVYEPYSNFHFTTDTITFKATTSNSAVFLGAWLTKASGPLGPGNDTMLLYQSLSYFKRR